MISILFRLFGGGMAGGSAISGTANSQLMGSDDISNSGDKNAYSIPDLSKRIALFLTNAMEASVQKDILVAKIINESDEEEIKRLYQLLNEKKSNSVTGKSSGSIEKEIEPKKTLIEYMIEKIPSTLDGGLISYLGVLGAISLSNRQKNNEIAYQKRELQGHSYNLQRNNESGGYDIAGVPVKSGKGQILELPILAGALSASPGPGNQGGGNNHLNFLRNLRIPKITLSEAADIVTLILAVKDALQTQGNNNNAGGCQPCCSNVPSNCDDATTYTVKDKQTDHLPVLESLNTKVGEIQTGVNLLVGRFVNNGRNQTANQQGRADSPEQNSLSGILGGVWDNVNRLVGNFLYGSPERAFNGEFSQIESGLKSVNTTLDNIYTSVGLLTDHVIRDMPDKINNNKTPQPDWSLMLLGNIAIDVKRMADKYVGSNLNPSSNGPVFQNIRDTAWLNNTLNGIQDNTTRAVSLLPVQPNNYFNQTNNFTISGAQEPRVVAEAVRDSVPMMSDFSQANQILQARAI